ncbi:MAG: arginine deiminase family protein [Gemmatimonadota bacterium]
MKAIHVTSEIGSLRSVLVHTPGNELLGVTPGTREDYLYDDVIDLENARREHRHLVAVLERFAEVVQVRDALAEIFAKTEVRDRLVGRALDIVPSDALAQRLSKLPVRELVDVLVAGAVEEPGPIAAALNEQGYMLPPLPNLFFTRDVGIVIGEHVVIGSMRYGVRWTEELLVSALFRFHPAFANAGILYDGSEERRTNFSLEGGDVHPLRPDLVVLGFSERSSPAALDYLTDVLFEKCGIEDVIVVVMPKEPTAIHLDMIFTQVDREMCVVYPPHFVGPERLAVLHRHKGQAAVKEMPNLFAALNAVRHPLEPIFCGGAVRADQEREQWGSACNFFSVRPGVVVGYDRHDATLKEMQKAGFRIVSARKFLTGEEAVADDGRAVIAVKGSELVRGGGGPRCMTMPLCRDDP